MIPFTHHNNSFTSSENGVHIIELGKIDFLESPNVGNVFLICISKMTKNHMKSQWKFHGWGLVQNIAHTGQKFERFLKSNSKNRPKSVFYLGLKVISETCCYILIVTLSAIDKIIEIFVCGKRSH